MDNVVSLNTQQEPPTLAVVAGGETATPTRHRFLDSTGEALSRAGENFVLNLLIDYIDAEEITAKIESLEPKLTQESGSAESAQKIVQLLKNYQTAAEDYLASGI